ncbi:ABC transporter substrate-binding protein [Paenibacillus antibioticophila]|uniref:ABC transporter substrate-binding protein n=1 Tax=Paenibacillus antibioticophila TaxID=1274374 RepID=UPI0006781F0E|nr:extracellular solute-binding protein [Paenibacillus antibioticophila]
MKNKKLWIISVLALVLVVAGCGGKSSGGNAGEAQGANQGAGKEEQVTIEIFNQKSEVKDYLNQIIQNFETENPNIKVNQVQVPDSRKVLYNRLASNDAPDIMSIFPNESDFRTQAGSDFFMDLTGSDVLANINPQFLEGVKVDGKDYSAPLTMNAYGIFYNAAKFNELGLKVPTTWAELEQTAAAIKEKGSIPFATSFKASWSVGHLTEALLTNAVGYETADKFFQDPAAKADSDPSIQKLLAQMDFIGANSQLDAAGADYPDAVNLFATGQALMLPQGIWAVPVIEQAGMEDEYKMFPIPNDSGNGVVVGGIDYALAISANTKHPEEAQKFVKFMTEQQTAQFLADNEKSPSTITGIKADAPQTEDVTKLLSEEGRFYPWLHFNWKAGLDSSWGTETSAYLILNDKNALLKWINQEFGK